MKKKINNIYSYISRYISPIIDIQKFILGIPRYLIFFMDFIKYKRVDKNNRVRLIDTYPQIHDNIKYTPFDNHYIYHPAWAARILNIVKPKKHVDISSSLHFCSLISAFIPVEFYDYRPAKLDLDNLESAHADLTNLYFENNSIKSLSCMHTIEHIGLGRYGDPIDPDGDLKAVNELKRVLAEDGDLLFVVPVGKSKIMYNAHRIYNYHQVLGMFSDLELVEFALIPDDKAKGLVRNADPDLVEKQKYACGCFWFKKKRKFQ